MNKNILIMMVFTILLFVMLLPNKQDENNTISNDCLSVEVVNNIQDIDIREIHNDSCGGDPLTAPRYE